MLNYIWAGMILIGIIFATFNGTMEAVAGGLVESAKEAIQLCLTMVGVVGMWTGLMKVAEESGLVEQLIHLLRPMLRFLFPGLRNEERILGYIATNMVANLLGLGWAATPSGIKAMKELQQRNKAPDVISNEMCTFLVINISSLQLIPINMIAFRGQYGSVNPYSIIFPGLIATGVSTLFGIAFCKAMELKSKKNKKV